jgi:hypothetical protein
MLKTPLLSPEDHLPQPPQHFFRFNEDNTILFMYVGEYYTNKDGKHMRHGKGTSYHPDKTNVYVGTYVDDEIVDQYYGMSGKKGSITEFDGDMDTTYGSNGDIGKGKTNAESKRYGLTTFTKPNGKVEQLVFVDGVATGPYTIHWPSGSYEEGQYVENKRHGLCITRQRDGKRLERRYVDGVLHGVQRDIHTNGTVEESDEYYGVKIGSARTTLVDGTVTKCEFQLGGLRIPLKWSMT